MEQSGAVTKRGYLVEAEGAFHKLLHERALKIASAYRPLVLWFGGQLLVTPLPILLSGMGRHPVVAVADFLVLGATVGTFFALAYHGYRTAAALGAAVPWLWSLAMFIPCVNALARLVLSARATRACRSEGIPVGFFGPRTPTGTVRRSEGGEAG